jgi:glycerophosphoryl diester phosphodiesterase
MKMIDIAKKKKFYVAGHRGYCAKYPENTLLSVKEAIDMGVDMVEIDIALSKDNIPMLCHDSTVDRTSNGTGLVSDYICAELKRLDVGIKFGKIFEGLKMPTFTEFCDLMRDYPEILINVDLKAGEGVKKAAEIVADIVKEYGYSERCVFNSLDGEVIAYMHDEHGFLTEGAPEGFYGFTNFVSGCNGTYSKMWSVCISIKDLSPELVQKFKNMGLLVWCWGTDDEQTVEYALECGVGLAVCNEPATCLRITKERGLR